MLLDPELHSTAMGGLLELVAAAPPLTISPLLLSDLQWIKVSKRLHYTSSVHEWMVHGAIFC